MGVLLARPGALEVRASVLHGRGVFAAKNYRKNALLEACPVLIGTVALDRSVPGYCFEWEKGAIALALGYGSLYNHSWTPNVWWELDYEARLARYFAARKIRQGEELTLKYVDDPEHLWFEPHD